MVETSAVSEQARSVRLRRERSMAVLDQDDANRAHGRKNAWIALSVFSWLFALVWLGSWFGTL